MKFIGAATGVCLLVACAGVGIVATNDPLTKLNDAAVLFGQQNRPLPAERLIVEALAIYANNNDAHGLGNSYREYADFLRSPAVARAQSHYSRDGFIDQSITFEDRFAKASEFYAKALEYYNQAAPQLRNAGRFDALTNVYFNAALVHVALGQKDQACIDFDRTLDAYNKNVQQTPSAKPAFPARFSSLSEALTYERQRAGCQA